MAITALGELSFLTRVEAWECDHNQHWNVRQYMRCFQQASYVVADMCGRPETDAGVYSQHTRYHRELLQTSPVEVRSAELADGEFAGAIVHILSSNGRLSATALDMPRHIDSGLPKVSEAEVALALPRSIAGGQHSAEPEPVAATAKVIEHGIVQPREADHTGNLGIDWLMGRIAAASNELLVGHGFTPEFARQNAISRMGVETKVTRLRAIPVGTRLQGVVRIAALGRKNLLLRHRFFTPDGIDIAAADQSLITVDMKTRRSTELPLFLKELAGSL